jgi:plasmid stability protein
MLSSGMANLQVKDIPEGMHRKLRAYARREGRTLRDLVLDVLQREVARREFAEGLARRQAVDLGRPAARSLEEARHERDVELGG